MELKYSRVIASKYSTDCPFCGETINIGDKIIKVNDAHWIHSTHVSELAGSPEYHLGKMDGFKAAKESSRVQSWGSYDDDDWGPMWAYDDWGDFD